MRTNHVLLILALVILAVAPLCADVPCPPSSPWPPASEPIVKTVPWVVPTPPLCGVTPHDTISGRTIWLKATTTSAASSYRWDFGDGTTTGQIAVSDRYNIGTQHVYNGSVGTSFTATVYVRDNATPYHENSAKYFVTVRDGSQLQVKVNIAIDEALWYLHRAMGTRSATGDLMTGNWDRSNDPYYQVYAHYVGIQASNTTAFLVNGHVPDSDPLNPNPYAETALRGLNITLTGLVSTGIPASVTNTHGTFSPDVNGNGIGVLVNNTHPPYQGGMVMDMLVATGLPDKVAAVGPAGVVGQTFSKIVQDMMDYYSYCQQVDAGHQNGGWRYSCQYGSSDNSVNQWAAIGLIGAIDRGFGSLPPPIPPATQSPVLLANQDFLNYTFSNGPYGYTDPNYYPWNPYALTPSGQVQNALSGLGRGTPGHPTHWDATENWLRANFTGPLGYYYGLFSFTKSMLLYPGGKLDQLCGRDAGNNLTNCIDWYADPALGVATRLVNAQNPNGYWYGHNYTGEQCYFETAWATIMLNRTVFQGGVPVAVIDASPSTIVNNGLVNLTGKNSFHQDPGKQIVKWEWDLSGTGSGAFTASGVNQNGVLISTSSPTFPASYPIRLRVTDNTTPTPLTAILTAVITITNPPFPPTAFPGGPYSICPQPAYLPFYFNGAGSTFAPGHAAGTTKADNFITNYEWDALGNGTYSISGADKVQPRADEFYASAGLLGSGSTILMSLRITDNSAESFGTAYNMQGSASTSVVLRSATDQLCTKCVLTGQAIPHGAVPGHAGYIQLVWLETGANHYNIYRGTVDGGPYTLLGTVLNTLVATGKSLGFTDNGPLTPGKMYYYRIAPATLADIETCQSNQASASGNLPKGR